MAYIGNSPSTKLSAAAKLDTFTGDGSTVTFDVANIIPAGGENGLQVYVDNVRQKPGSGNAYTVGNDGSGDLKRITFTEAPASAAEIYVITPYEAQAILNVADGTITKEKLATSVVTGHTALTTGVQGADTLLLHDDSASALKKITLDDLITGQTELSAVAADDDVLLIYDTSAAEIKKIQKSNIATTLTYSTNANLTGDGSTINFTISQSGRAANNILVTVNGVLFFPPDDYSLAGTTLTFSTAPSAAAEIRVRYLPI